MKYSPYREVPEDDKVEAEGPAVADETATVSCTWGEGNCLGGNVSTSTWLAGNHPCFTTIPPCKYTPCHQTPAQYTHAEESLLVERQT